MIKERATEDSHVANVGSQSALAFPGVKFTLLIDGRVALRTPGSGKLIDSVVEVYGAEVAQKMLAIESTVASPPRVTGMAGCPSVSRAGGGHLSFFGNRRWGRSRLGARAVAGPPGGGVGGRSGRGVAG